MVAKLIIRKPKWEFLWFTHNVGNFFWFCWNSYCMLELAEKLGGLGYNLNIAIMTDES